MQASRRGFTLFELLTVMMVLAILVTLVISLGRHADLQTKRHQALADLGRWQEALQGYYLSAGQYPDKCYNGPVTNLLAVIGTNAQGQVVTTFAGQMTSSLNATDAWFHLYQYTADTNAAPQSYDLFSWGPNSNNPSVAIRLGR